ncbi:RNA polymerase sigma factor [Bosea sp. (in: a-proteobacteria)]
MSGAEILSALTMIFLNERRSLIGTVLRIVRDPQTAEDLAQEAYLRVRKSMEAAPIEHVEAFLHQTARNLALDHERRRKTRERFEAADISEQDVASIPADVPTIEAALIERERLRAFNAALNALPERARQAWILSQIHGWSYARIADHLNVARNTVYNDIKLVVAHCQQTLARHDRD